MRGAQVRTDTWIWPKGERASSSLSLLIWVTGYAGENCTHCLSLRGASRSLKKGPVNSPIGLAAGDNDREIWPEQAGFDVCVEIVFHVSIFVVVRHELAHEALNIASHIRIGFLSW